MGFEPQDSSNLFARTMRDSVSVRAKSSWPSAFRAAVHWRGETFVLSGCAIAAYAVAETAIPMIAAIIGTPSLRSEAIWIR